MSTFRYGAGLLLGAAVLMGGVVLVLKRLDEIGQGPLEAVEELLDTEPTAVTAATDSAAAVAAAAGADAGTVTDASIGTPNGTATGAAMDVARGPASGARAATGVGSGAATRSATATTDPSRTTAAPRAATPPWRPSAAQAFADSLFLTLRAADTASARRLLAAWADSASAPDAERLRLAARLARAQGDHAASLAYYRRALAASNDADEARALQRELAAALREAGRSGDAVVILADLVSVAPRDTLLRAELAEAAREAGRTDQHLAQLDTLASLVGTAAAHERLAFARDAAGDEAGARAALRTAVRLQPTAERWIMLADRLRWADSLDAAVDAYGRALALQPGAPRAMEGLAVATRLRREAEPDAPPAPLAIGAPRPLPAERGIGTLVRAGDDNTGWGFRALGVEAGVPIAPDGGLLLLADADVRRVERLGLSAVTGWRAGAGLLVPVGRGAVSARAGRVSHERIRDVTTWAAMVRAPVGPVELRADAQRDVAYETLRAGATLGPVGTDTSLTATSARLTAFGRIAGPLEFWTQAEVVSLGDDNTRRGVQLALQQPVRRGVSLVATGGVMGFTDRRTAYWTPSRYALGALGLDLRLGTPETTQLYARILPGLADVQGIVGGSGQSFQLSATAGAIATRGAWRAEAEAAAGRDREGGYRAWSGTLRVRRTLP